MSVEKPTPPPEDLPEQLPATFTPEKITQLAESLKQMSHPQREIVWEQIESVFPTIDDPELMDELAVLQHRALLLNARRYQSLPDEERDQKIEEEIRDFREALQQRRTSTGRPLERPWNRSVFGDNPPTEEQRAEMLPETEQSRFFNFLTERIQTGIIPFNENGKPGKKAMHDSILLYFRPDEAGQRRIPEALPEQTPRQPLTQEQTTYLDQLRGRVERAAGHTDTRLPKEPSIHKIIRELNK